MCFSFGKTLFHLFCLVVTILSFVLAIYFKSIDEFALFVVSSFSGVLAAITLCAYVYYDATKQNEIEREENEKV